MNKDELWKCDGLLRESVINLYVASSCGYVPYGMLDIVVVVVVVVVLFWSEKCLSEFSVHNMATLIQPQKFI